MKKRYVLEYLAAHPCERIAEVEWQALLRAVPGISESYLREILHEAAIPVEQPYAGVCQKSFDELEASLVAMERVYRAAVEAADRVRSSYCRKVVIGAKDRAKFAARNAKTPEKREQKQEMAQWMLVWLENPGVFESWVALRKEAISPPPHSAARS